MHQSVERTRENLREEVNPQSGSERNVAEIDKPEARDNLNALLSQATAPTFITPYNGLERVRKILAYYHIHIPGYVFLSGKHGVEVWDVNQYGIRAGMNDKGEFVTKGEVDQADSHFKPGALGPEPIQNFSSLETDSTSGKFYVYFEYKMSDSGRYIVFCEVVNDDELAEIERDVDSESEDA